MRLNSMNTCTLYSRCCNRPYNIQESIICVSLHCTAGAAIGTGEHKTEFTVDL